MQRTTRNTLLIFFSFSLGTVCAQPTVAGAFNAGDYSTDLAPGSYVAIFGTRFASSNAIASSLPLPVTLGGASVAVSGNPVPLLFVSPGQINAQLPYGISGTVNLTVTTTAGTSTSVPVRIVPNAPKFYTSSQTGSGFIVATHSNFSLVQRGSAATSGETVILYMNSMGNVTPPVAAGAVPGDGGRNGDFNRLVTRPVVLLDTVPGNVTYAGLAPGFPGLYQVNFTTPYNDKIGDAAITVTDGTASTQRNVTLPVVSNGLYWAITGSKFVNGQTLNGAPGPNSSLAFRHNSPGAFGTAGLNTWTKNTNFAPSYAAIAGVALTLKSGGKIVFDNNGIETGDVGSYYSTSPGRSVLFCMSLLSSPTVTANNVKGAYAGYFKLNAATTVDQMIGYFEGPDNVDPPFNSANIYNTYHMNIFSNVNGGFSNQTNSPKELQSFIGDVFSDDKTPGLFSFSKTTVDRVLTPGNNPLAETHVPVYRLVYTLAAPLTLPAGEYWFSHDVSTPQSDSISTANAGRVPTATESLKLRHLRPESAVKE